MLTSRDVLVTDEAGMIGSRQMGRRWRRRPPMQQNADARKAVEAHPALRSTLETFSQQMRQASEAAQQQGRRELASAVQRVGATGAELERLAERQCTGREQVRQLAIITAVGAVAGVIVWVGFSRPIARALPASWRVPEKMAAATLRLDRWNAGAQLMRTADRALWNGLAAASSLWRENAGVLEDCTRQAARSGKPQRCAVTVEPHVHAPG